MRTNLSQVGPQVGGDIAVERAPEVGRRVASILLAKEAGLALADIRDILTTADAGKRREITRSHCDDLVRRIEEMRAALNLLEGGLTCDYEDITECPHYQSLVADKMTRTMKA